jgi:hypothetical protein
MSITTKQGQIKEIVRCGKDPVYFINKYIKIQHPTRGLIPFNTYPFQDECVDDFLKHRFNIILKSRQLGISTLAAAYAVWLAAFYKDKNILIIATRLAVAQNFIKKVKVALRAMPKWLLIPEMTINNRQSVELSNGSSIKAIPTSEDAGRSEALSLLIVDEAAFVRNFDTLWTSLYPTISTGGRAIVLSTPNGMGGQYYDIWVKAENKENEFNPIKLPWDVHPEHDQAWFDNECRNFTTKQIAQELLCDFSSSGDTYFSNELIEKLSFSIRNPVERWGPEMGVWVWKYGLSEHSYVISGDVARGDSSDYSAFHVIDIDESEVVAEFRGKIPPDQFALILAEAAKRYNNAMICPENNTYGYAVIMKLRDIGYTNLYFKNEKDKFGAIYGSGEVDISKAGFTTSGQSRSQILTKLEEVIRNNAIQIYSSRFYQELKTFVWTGTKAQAQKGKHDDLIMSLAIGVWLYDASPKNSHFAKDLNKAMLAGFAVNSTKKDAILSPWAGKNHNPFKPFVLNEMPSKQDDTGAPSPYGDMNWLLR